MGTSSDSIQQGSERQDHPHTCGDKATVIVAVPDFVGSSPRVWGQGTMPQRRTSTAGIIPTRVGTSPIDSRGNAFIEDHPHACGDKMTSKVDSVESLGSSPRVWGQVLMILGTCLSAGIIPTRVGTRRSEVKNKGH